MNRLNFIKRLTAAFLSLFIPKSTLANNQKRRYFLTKFYIAGFYYYEGDSVVQKLKLGEELIIVQEPSNPFDRRALEIYTKENVKLGYVPRYENPIPSRLLRQNVKIIGIVDKINLGESDWRKVRVSLFAEV